MIQSIYNEIVLFILKFFHFPFYVLNFFYKILFLVTSKAFAQNETTETHRVSHIFNNLSIDSRQAIYLKLLLYRNSTSIATVYSFQFITNNLPVTIFRMHKVLKWNVLETLSGKLHSKAMFPHKHLLISWDFTPIFIYIYFLVLFSFEHMNRCNSIAVPYSIPRQYQVSNKMEERFAKE